MDTPTRTEREYLDFYGSWINEIAPLPYRLTPTGKPYIDMVWLTMADVAERTSDITFYANRAHNGRNGQ